MDNFDDDDNDDDETAGVDGEQKSAKDGVYKPPKLAAVRYEGDGSKADKMEKRDKMRAKAIANASMLMVLFPYPKSWNMQIGASDLLWMDLDK